MYIDDYLIIVTFSDVFLVQNIHSKVKSSRVVNNSQHSQQQPATTTDPHGDGKKVFRGVPASSFYQR